MKLRNIIYSVVAVSTLALTSCSDSYLDEKMYSNYGTDVADVEAKVIGLHYKFAALWGMSSRQGFTGIWQDGTDVGAPGDTEGVEVPFFQYGSRTWKIVAETISTIYVIRLLLILISLRVIVLEALLTNGMISWHVWVNTLSLKESNTMVLELWNSLWNVKPMMASSIL